MGASESKVSLADALRAVATKERTSELEDSILMEDILESIPSSVIREVVQGNTEAAFTIIGKLVGVIKKFISPGHVGSFPTIRHYVSDGANIRRLLYACRMLCRILPLIFESRPLRYRLAAILCPVEDGNPADREGAAASPSADPAIEEDDWTGLAPAVLDLLFVPGFTLPDSATEENVKVFYSIWESGIGSERQMDSFHQVDLNRMEVIRLILVLFSWRMYQEPSSRELPPFAYVISCRLREPLVLSLLCSLLNVILKFDPNGWGVPYSHLFLGDENDEQLATLCVQLLNLLLDFDPALYHGECAVSKAVDIKIKSLPRAEGSPGLGALFEDIGDKKSTADSASDAGHIEDTRCDPGGTSLLDGALLLDDTEENVVPVDKDASNLFRHYLSKLYREADFRRIYIGFLALLSNPIKASAAMLPAAHRQIAIYPEIMVLLWRMIDTNAAFFKFIIYEEGILDLVAALAYYASSAEMDQSADGLVHLSCFVLLQLSSERELAIRLNAPFLDHRKVAEGVEFSGTYADLLILSFVRILSLVEGRLLTIGECLLTAILNIAPYVKSMSAESTHRLVAIFERVVCRAMDDSSMAHAKCAQLIIRTFVAVIQYQYDGNVHLIAALLRKRRLFEGVSSLTYADYTMGISPVVEEAPAAAAPIESFSVPPEGAEGRVWAEAEFAEAARLVDCSLLVQVFLSIDPDLRPLMGRRDAVLSEDEMVAFLRRRTLVGLIPVAYPLQVVRFRMSPEIQAWLTSYLYGIICLHQEQASLWNDTAIRLFVVKYEGEEAAEPDVLPLMP